MKNLLHRHKAIIIAMVSLVVMCGCAEKEIDTPIKQEDKLYFKQTIDGQEDEQLNSRAYTGDVKFETRGFTVAGYRTNGMFSVSNLNNLPFPNVFDIDNPGVDKSVIKIDIDNSETNINRKYWTKLPKFSLSSIYNISYFAWSSSEDNTITAATSSAGDKGYPWIEANVGAANTNQPDIVGALSMNHSNEYTVSAIDLDFKHLLSKMSFFVKTSNGMTANITKVECVYGASAVYSQARFTFDGTADVGLWSDHKTYLATGAVTPNNWNNATTTGPSTLLGSMTLIPQSLTDNALSLKISYTTTQEGATSEPITRNVPLKAIDLKPGKNYVYTLDLNANEITFNVKVEGWIEMLGTDKGLPLVPGLMDPEVLLLLEGTDPPYTTADGRRYWLDRSGWNNHCQIMDKQEFGGSNSYDITHNADERGYMFYRTAWQSGLLFNHISTPDLGVVNGNISCEVICEDKSPVTNWNFSLPLTIAQGVRPYNEQNYMGRVLLISTNESNQNHWDYAKGPQNTTTDTPDTYERLTFAAPYGHEWRKRTYYAYSRTNNGPLISIINNTSLQASTAINNTTTYALKHGMIGSLFNGTINYIKVQKRSMTFDEMMNNFAIVSSKYNIKTTRGAYAPNINGLLACWDARTGLMQGSSNGNGAYWMDQSGNGYFLKAVVPQGVSASIKHNVNAKAIVFESPKYPNIGTEMFNPRSMGKTKQLTFELIYEPKNISYDYALVFLNDLGKDEVICRTNTGAGFGEFAWGADDNRFYNPGSPICHFDHRPNHTNKQSAVAIVDYENRKLILYINGVHKHTKEIFPENIPNDGIMNLYATILGNRSTHNQAFTGNLHAFRVYNRVLTAAEIQANYNTDRVAFGL